MKAKKTMAAATHHSAEALGHEWMPVSRINQEPSERNDEHHHRDFNDDDDGIGFARFLEFHRTSRIVTSSDDEKRRQVDGDGCTGNHWQRCRRKILPALHRLEQ